MFHKMDFIFSVSWILCIFVSGSQGETYSISCHACNTVMSSSSLSHYVFDVMMTFTVRGGKALSYAGGNFILILPVILNFSLIVWQSSVTNCQTKNSKMSVYVCGLAVKMSLYQNVPPDLDVASDFSSCIQFRSMV